MAIDANPLGEIQVKLNVAKRNTSQCSKSHCKIPLAASLLTFYGDNKASSESFHTKIFCLYGFPLLKSSLDGHFPGWP